MKMSKQKIYEILLTAFISALIAFLQSVLIPLNHQEIAETTPAVAGVIGACIRCIRA